MAATFETITDTVYKFLPIEERILAILSQLKNGLIVLHLPDGKQVTCGDPSLPPVTIKVYDSKFWRRVAMRLDVGLGESYMDKEWDCDNLIGYLAETTSF